MNKYQDRIIELRRMRAGDLRANPKNWRRHPKAQQDAMRGVLKEVGFADALLAYQTPEGLTLVDGHLRAGLEPDQEVPVLILDLDETEAEKLLVTLDPLAAMAETDVDALNALLADMTFSDESITAMLDSIANHEGVLVPEFDPVMDEPPRLDEKTPISCPECGHEFTI